MDYLDMALGAVQALAPEVQRYAEQDSRCLPIRIEHVAGQYGLFGASGNNTLLFVKTPSLAAGKQTTQPDQSDKPLTVNDCVVLCRSVLGLKINEIAKLTRVSRATLDLHRKGANVKDMTEYQKVYDFVALLEASYGDSLKNGMRNILIRRKTLLQHFMVNKGRLDKTNPVVKEVAAKLANVTTTTTDIDASKANSRLAGIGRMA